MTAELAQLQSELAQTQQENARLRAENHALTRGAATAVTESANARLALRALERETQACYRCGHAAINLILGCECCHNDHNGFPEPDPEN